MPGTLYIVSTPIGNLEDITLRALRILKESDLIAAEDTRRSRKLLTHFDIKTPMISYWGAKEKVKAEEVLGHLFNDKDVALISDAGTPGISDPGAVLVRRALEESLDVVPIPGPSAMAAALSISGLPTESFTFIGFLPPKTSQRKKFLNEIAIKRETLIFYEAPHRILDTLVDMEDVFGADRKAAIARELTKLHEEVLRGTLLSILDDMENTTVAGEFVVVVEGRTESEPVSEDEVMAEMRSLMRSGFSRKDAARKISSTYGLSKKKLYDRSLE